MDILTFLAIVVVIAGAVIVSIYLINKWEKINNRSTETEKFNLFSKINPSSVNEEIEKWIKEYMNTYIFKNIISQGTTYIKSEEADALVKNVTRGLLIEMSDMYLFYIKLLVNLNDDDSLVEYMYRKVSKLAINFITEFNSPK